MTRFRACPGPIFDLDEQIQLRVEEQRVFFSAEANQKAAVAVEIADRDAQLKELAETLNTVRERVGVAYTASPASVGKGIAEAVSCSSIGCRTQQNF
ncbi:hypothetical protein [Rosistilla oblonga]|uniref:hypothetical protein n=1 Tax=Rosistilla oblonga TaxID=2527990 RepID=UPI0011A4FCC7|nr:hypothetical protein [Rosistilla oblonga]